jgi:hypothetical protein
MSRASGCSCPPSALRPARSSRTSLGARAWSLRSSSWATRCPSCRPLHSSSSRRRRLPPRRRPPGRRRAATRWWLPSRGCGSRRRLPPSALHSRWPWCGSPPATLSGGRAPFGAPLPGHMLQLLRAGAGRRGGRRVGLHGPPHGLRPCGGGEGAEPPVQRWEFAGADASLSSGGTEGVAAYAGWRKPTAHALARRPRGDSRRPRSRPPVGARSGQGVGAGGTEAEARPPGGPAAQAT